MKKSKKVIDLLNEARARELTALTQYMGQHYEMEDQGYGKLAAVLKEVGIQEMKHAEALAERILFLEGEPTRKPDAVTKKGEDIPKLLKTDVALEDAAIKMYNAAANACAAEGDQVSSDLFKKLLAEEEEHLDRFQKLADHVEAMGACFMATLAD